MTHKITVCYVPKTEAPGRPVRIDYGTIAHEYITREDAREINDRSLLSDRCAEATGIRPEWPEVREAYSQLAAVLGGLDAPVTDADFDLFPKKPQVWIADENGTRLEDAQTVPEVPAPSVPMCRCVVTGAKVSDSDEDLDFTPPGDLAMDLRGPEPDPVHSPSHYTDGGIETIDYLEAKLTREEFVGFCRGNALKYLSRAGKKGEAAEDFAKAAWYCARAEKASR